jgi:hypothetical protein
VFHEKISFYIVTRIQGMNESQKILEVTTNDGKKQVPAEDVAPNGRGVDLENPNDSLKVTLGNNGTVILAKVSSPVANEEVEGIRVIVKESDGTVIANETSPKGLTTVTFSNALRVTEGGSIEVSHVLPYGVSAKQATLSIVGCFELSNTTTVVTIGTPSPSPSGTTVYMGTGTVEVGSQTTLITTTTTSPSAMTDSAGTVFCVPCSLWFAHRLTKQDCRQQHVRSEHSTHIETAAHFYSSS